MFNESWFSLPLKILTTNRMEALSASSSEGNLVCFYGKKIKTQKVRKLFLIALSSNKCLEVSMRAQICRLDHWRACNRLNFFSKILQRLSIDKTRFHQTIFRERSTIKTVKETHNHKMTHYVEWKESENESSRMNCSRIFQKI